MQKHIVDVIDDDDAIRDSIAFLLDVNGYQVRIHPNAQSFLKLGAVESSCVVTDIRMPGMSGLDLMRTLSESANQPPVIMITGHGDIPLAVEAMKAGVFDFIEKPFDDTRLISSIREAIEAKSGEDRSIEPVTALIGSLSPRERDVLKGLLVGKTNKVIAREHDISPRTVEVYRANLMAKTGARSFSELMRLAIKAGL